MRKRFIFACNALDDKTRLERGITTDSPAATNKIIGMSKALRLNGARPIILSMGRGAVTAEWRGHSAVVRRISGLPIIYIPFTPLPIFSQLLSAYGLIYMVIMLRLRGIKHLILYNRALAFLPALLASSLMGYQKILDLEDGEVGNSTQSLSLILASVVTHFYDLLCKRALLACSALVGVTSIRPTLCYYGAVFNFLQKNKLQSNRITILMSGTLIHDTGSDLFIDLIKLMRKNKSPWIENIRFEITGTGDCLIKLRQLAADFPVPEVVVHGRLSEFEYASVLTRADVGLSLKLNGGPYANTTFPSKVIEYAASDLLVVTTDISDVKTIFGDGALYLERDEPQELLNILEQIAAKPIEAFQLAKIGQNRVKKMCAPQLVGKSLSDFIFGSE